MPVTREGLDQYMATLRRKPQPALPEPAAQPRRVAQFNPTALGLRPAPAPAPVHATTKPAAVQPAPAPMHRPRAVGLFRCEACGQTWHIEPAGGTFNTNKPTRCPSCPGDAPLVPVQDSFNGLTAACFKQDLQVERLLAQLLYEQWAANKHGEQARYARFVDYLKEQLNS